MTGDRVFGVLGSIVTVALVTTVLMRGSAAAQIIDSLGRAFSSSLTAAQGR